MKTFVFLFAFLVLIFVPVLSTDECYWEGEDSDYQSTCVSSDRCYWCGINYLGLWRYSCLNKFATRCNNIEDNNYKTSTPCTILDCENGTLTAPMLFLLFILFLSFI